MHKALNVKRLCLANGDEYENITLKLTKEELMDAIKDGNIVVINLCGKEIVLNSEFIISIEIGESNKLKVI